MDRPNLAKLNDEKRAAAAFHVRALKDRLRIEAAFLKLQQEIQQIRASGAPDGAVADQDAAPGPLSSDHNNPS